MLLGPVIVVVVIFVVGTFCKPPKIVKSTVFANPQKRQIGGVFAIFHIIGTKKHRKYRCFWLRANAKPRYLRGFEPLLARITVFTVFCSPGLAKTLVFTQFPACCQKLFLHAKGTKNIVNYTIFTRGQYQKIMKNSPKIDQKTPNKDLQNASSNLTLFFPTPNPQKRENPSSLKDFREGRRVGPRVAKAMLSNTTARRGIAGFIEWASALVPPTPLFGGCGGCCRERERGRKKERKIDR